MAQPYVGEIRMFAGNFAPAGWMFCEGQLIPISENETLFQLIGTTYGGDGQSTFALPDLRGRTPIHVGSGHTLGERGGEQAHTLSIAELPTHAHVFQGTSANAAGFVPTNNVLARGVTAVNANPINYYSQTVTNLVALQPGTISNTGGSQAHLNMQPFLTLSFCIALQGIFPSPN